MHELRFHTAEATLGPPSPRGARPAQPPATAHEADKEGGLGQMGALGLRDGAPGTRDPTVPRAAASPKVREHPEAGRRTSLADGGPESRAEQG